jgi:hypothetical protein
MRAFVPTGSATEPVASADVDEPVPAVDEAVVEGEAYGGGGSSGSAVLPANR